MSERTYSLYVLCTPRSLDVRYVGATVDHVRRYKQHCVAKLPHAATKMVTWIKRLRREGRVPIMVVLETGIPSDKVASYETYLSRYLVRIGRKLINSRPAGGGFH